MVDEQRRLTYAELEAGTNRLAHALSRIGVMHGDTVGLLVGNSVRFVEVYLAIVKLGAVAVPFNTRLAPPELEFCIRNSECRVLVADDPNTARADSFSAAVERVIAGDDALRSLLQPDLPGEPPAAEVHLDDPNVILYTSGTTGVQKGVVLTHANLLWNGLNEIIDTDMHHNDVTLLVTPMYHSASLNCWFAPHLFLGATSVLVSHFDPELVLRTIERERVTNMFHVPSMLRTLLQHPDLERFELRSLERLYVGGASFQMKDKQAVVQRLGRVAMYYQYGLTEAGPIVSVLRPEDMFRPDKDGSIGREFQNTLVKIVDADGREVLPGEVGEMVMRGPTIMRGYFHNDAATASALRDGWLHSGDLAARDADGFLYFRDRLKDMIKSGGENVYSAEVEQVLYAHPDVQEAAVMGVASERWDEEVRAVVVRRPGSAISAENLMAFCRASLAGYKVPKQIVFIPRDQMPINLSGKVLKRDLAGRVEWPT